MNKEEIKKELKAKMEKEIDQYVDKMAQGFQKDHFDIGEIEELWGNAIDGCKTVLKDGTVEMINTTSEKEIIVKKKQN